MDQFLYGSVGHGSLPVTHCLLWYSHAPGYLVDMVVTVLHLPGRARLRSLQYCLKLSANRNNPAYNAVFDPKFTTQFDKNQPNSTSGINSFRRLTTSRLKKKNVLPTTVSTTPPWLLKQPAGNLLLYCYDKTTRPTSPELLKCKFFELRLEFPHHLEIYTDGSKDGLRTAAAVVAPDNI